MRVEIAVRTLADAVRDMDVEGKGLICREHTCFILFPRRTGRNHNIHPMEGFGAPLASMSRRGVPFGACLSRRKQQVSTYVEVFRVGALLRQAQYGESIEPSACSAGPLTPIMIVRIHGSLRQAVKRGVERSPDCLPYSSGR
jgi:hypothetical protein